MGKEARPGLPTGDELARAACRHLGIRRDGENLSELLQYLLNSFAGSKPELHRWLRQKLKDGRSHPGGAHHLLLRLPTHQYLTTNYDNLLANAAARIPSYTLRVVNTPREFQRRRRRDVAVLAALHGDFRTSHHIVATTNDYIDNYNTRREWRRLLERLFRSRNVVFIGYSLRDFTTWTSYISTRFRSQARMRMHVMVAPKSGNYLSRYWENYGIHYVPLTAGQFLTAVHWRLRSLSDEDVAVAAVAANLHTSMRRARERLVKAKAEYGFADIAVAAEMLIQEAYHADNTRHSSGRR